MCAVQPVNQHDDLNQIGQTILNCHHLTCLADSGPSQWQSRCMPALDKALVYSAGLVIWLKHSYSNMQDLNIPCFDIGCMSAVLQRSSSLVRIHNILNNCLLVSGRLSLSCVITNPTCRRSHSVQYLFDALSPFICWPSSMPIPNPATFTYSQELV